MTRKRSENFNGGALCYLGSKWSNQTPKSVGDVQRIVRQPVDGSLWMADLSGQDGRRSERPSRHKTAAGHFDGTVYMTSCTFCICTCICKVLSFITLNEFLNCIIFHAFLFCKKKQANETYFFRICKSWWIILLCLK